MPMPPVACQSQSAYTRPVEPYLETSGAPATAPDRADRDWLEVDRSLLSLQSLRDDWDAEGARAPSSGVIRIAIRVLHCLREQGWAPPVTAVASPLGGILLTWEDGPAHFEVEVVSPTRVDYIAIRGDEIVSSGTRSL